MAQKHICGQCQKEFASEKLYTEHMCKATGFQPMDIDHFGPQFKEQSKTALDRGKKRKEKEEKK